MQTEKNAAQIDRYDTVEIVERLLGEGHDFALDTGIVAGAVETSEPLDRLCDQSIDICRIGNIRRREEGVTALLPDQVRGFFAAFDINVGIRRLWLPPRQI
ncbi:MAG: hypothetical protein AMXMBFR74_08020 [Parvibaculum sp.]